MKTTKSMNDNDIKISGIDLLNKVLGPINAYKFIMLIRREPKDYIDQSHNLFKGESARDIFYAAKSRWEKKQAKTK